MTDACLPTDLLVDFLEGRVETAALQQLEDHASRCEACRELLSCLARDGTPPPEPLLAWPHGRPLAPGTAVGRYVVTHELGAGGMGVVYAAHDPELDRLVAVKLLRADGDPRMRERLRREAQTMAQLAHPNVVAVYDAGTFDDRVFIAMEHVGGETLARWLALPRSPREILEMFRAAGSGLAAAHAVGIVHRDFKPDNVLIGKDGRVRVGDFGLARSTGGVASGTPADVALDGLTQDGTLLGTPSYMAPELHAGGEADARSDQFSFCVALYIALYRARPFAGDSLEALADNVRAGRLREPPPGSARRVRAAIARGLAVDPAARFASIDDLLVALAPPRRRGQTVALIALGAALAATVWWLAHTPVAPPCEGDGEAFARAWNPARRIAIDAAFAATRLPYAGDAAHRVDEAFDRYAARWRAGYRDACRATRVLGEQTEAMLDLRMICLERRREEAAALAATFASADAGVVTRAVPAAAGLVDVAGCADRAALQQVVPPPADVVTRTQLAALAPRLADARAKYETGAYRAALAPARQITADARALGYLPFTAEAALLQAMTENALGDVKAAEASAFAALWAAEAGRHDALAANTWTQLLMLIGYSQSDAARAELLVPRATAAMARLGANPTIEANLELALGALDYKQRKLDRAAAHEDKARALVEAAYGPSDPAVAKALEALGTTVMEQGEFTRGLPLLERARRIWERVLGPQHPRVALALHNLGVGHLSTHDYAAAERELRSALAIREAAYGARHRDLVGTLTALAVAVRRGGRLDEAVALHRRALALGEQLFAAGDPELIEPLYYLGAALVTADQRAEADRLLARAEALGTTALGPAHPFVMAALAMRGELVLRAGHPREAIAMFERAIAVLVKEPPANEDCATAQLGLARAHLALGAPDRAAAVLSHIAIEQQPIDLRGGVSLAMARALEQRDPARARALATRALAELTSSPASARAEVAQAERWLAAHPAR